MQLLLTMYTIVLSNAKNSIIMMDNDDAKLIKSKQLGKYGKARSKPQYQIAILQFVTGPAKRDQVGTNYT